MSQPADSVAPLPSDQPDDEGWFSNQLVLVIQLVFAIVIAESLGDYKQIVTNPFVHANRLAGFSLILVYLTALWSWVGWHKSITGSAKSYRFYADPWRPTRETSRFYIDLFIVIAYSYLLFSIDTMVGNNRADLQRFLDGYVVVAALYLAWTFCRTPLNSDRIRRNSTYFAIIIGIRIAYQVAQNHVGFVGWSKDNYIAIALVLVVTIIYRFRGFGWRSAG